MAEKSIQEISKELRELFEKGKLAYERNNLEYAIQLQEMVLKQEPGFYKAREALRATQLKKQANKSGFFRKILGSAGSSPQIAKAQLALLNRPLDALPLCESVLNTNPHHGAAHKILAAAAMKLGMIRTAVLSLEMAHKQSPEDKEIGLRLGEALIASRNTSRAQQLLKELKDAHPHDAEIHQAYKDASANHTLQAGRYDTLADGKGSYRDVLKDEEQAIRLEQDQREVRTEDIAMRMIEEQILTLESQPDNVKAMQKAAELYTQVGDYPQARAYYQRLIDHAEGTPDPLILKAFDNLKLKEIDRELDSLQGEDAASNQQRAHQQEQRKQLELEQCQRRADQYPNDLAIKYELGLLHYQLGHYQEAIPLFQKSQANPHLRIRSLHHLGKSFLHRGIVDLALRPIQTALAESVVFDEQKKELLYDLGLIHEKLDQADESIQQFKAIYEVDITFRDVGERVEAHYLK